MMDRTSIATLPETALGELSAHNTYGTNAIEGSTMTLEEVEAVLIDKVTVPNKQVHELMETVQHDMVFRGLKDRLSKPIGLVTVLELHEGVFRGIKMDAGEWRHVNVFIRNANFRPPSYEKVVPSMDKWEKEYQQMEKEVEDVFAVGAMMHSSFERIHPFSDGNGRVGRLLLNLHLMQHNWPPINLGPAEKERYFDGLAHAGEGDYAKLQSLFEEAMARSLLMVLDKVGTDEDLPQPLKELEDASGYSQKYLSLRARQGELPALKVKNEYYSSRRAVALYQKHIGN